MVSSKVDFKGAGLSDRSRAVNISRKGVCSVGKRERLLDIDGGTKVVSEACRAGKCATRSTRRLCSEVLTPIRGWNGTDVAPGVIKDSVHDLCGRTANEDEQRETTKGPEARQRCFHASFFLSFAFFCFRGGGGSSV